MKSRSTFLSPSQVLGSDDYRVPSSTFRIRKVESGTMLASILDGPGTGILEGQRLSRWMARDVRLPGKGSFNSHGARPVHIIGPFKGLRSIDVVT